MRLIMFLAVIFLAIAFVCAVVPTTLAFGAQGWFILGMLTWAIDVLVGGFVTPVPRRVVR
jgi:hypothetical protein